MKPISLNPLKFDEAVSDILKVIPESKQREAKMPKLKIEVPHKLTQEEALNRIKGLLGEVKTQFADKISNLQENWRGNMGTFSFSAMGFSVSGSLSVTPSMVELFGNLPFAALFFKGKIEATIRERAETLLA